jgi:hypothetical protein
MGKEEPNGRGEIFGIAVLFSAVSQIGIWSTDSKTPLQFGINPLM